MTNIAEQEPVVIPEETSRRLDISDPANTMAVYAEVKRQHDAAQDFIVPANKLSPYPWDPKVQDSTPEPAFRMAIPLDIVGGQTSMVLGVNKIAHEQLADRTGMGMYYYRKLLSNPKHASQWAADLWYWLAQLGDQKLLVRTLDGNIRAILSNKYFVLDNFDTLLHTVNVVQETQDALVQRIDVTEEKFYVRILHVEHALRLEKQGDAVRQVVDQGLTDGLFGGITDGQGHVAHSAGAASVVQDNEMHGPRNKTMALFEQIALHDDWIIPGVLIRNSEVGRGGLNIEPFFLQTYCGNRAVFGRSFGRIHRGSELDDMLTDDTRRKQRDAIFGEIRDVITATFDPEKFRNHVDRFLGLQSEQLENPSAAVETLKKVDSSFTDQEQQQILNALMTQGLGSTAYALVNAVTLYAHQQPDVDRMAELETIAGGMIESWPRELVTVRR